MPYKDYIASHPHWQEVRKARLNFDGKRCVVCHKVFSTNEPYQTHHLNYAHLGNEHIRDVITLCDSCHYKFHAVWTKQTYWRGRDSNHWMEYNIEYTAKICFDAYKWDKLICRDPHAPNLCNEEKAKAYIKKWLEANEPDFKPNIDPHDVILFVRNKRWELFFAAEDRGLTKEEFLTEYYGEKVRGKNPIRQEAESGSTFKHDSANMHRHYKENTNLNKLMKEVNNLENGGF